MARIRSIKPKFYEDTTLADLSLQARYLYIALWCYMDGNGICENDLRIIKKNVFPYDEAISTKDVDTFLKELVSKNRLVEFIYQDKNYFICPKFSEHQKIHHTEKSYYNDDLVKYALDNRYVTVTEPLEPRKSLREESIRKERREKKAKTEKPESSDAEASGPHPLVKLWNTHCGSLAKVTAYAGVRRTRAESCWKNKPDPDHWRLVIERIAASSFCQGQSGGSWRADFDFLVKPDTQNKVLEGKYDNRNMEIKSDYSFLEG